VLERQGFGLHGGDGKGKADGGLDLPAIHGVFGEIAHVLIWQVDHGLITFAASDGAGRAGHQHQLQQ